MQVLGVRPASRPCRLRVSGAQRRAVAPGIVEKPSIVVTIVSERSQRSAQLSAALESGEHAQYAVPQRLLHGGELLRRDQANVVAIV